MKLFFKQTAFTEFSGAVRGFRQDSDPAERFDHTDSVKFNFRGRNAEVIPDHARNTDVTVRKILEKEACD